MAQHKHNKPCLHRHSNLWWPSKAYKPVTVTEPPLQGADSRRSTVRSTKQESRRVAKRRWIGGGMAGQVHATEEGPETEAEQEVRVGPAEQESRAGLAEQESRVGPAEQEARVGLAEQEV